MVAAPVPALTCLSIPCKKYSLPSKQETKIRKRDWRPIAGDVMLPQVWVYWVTRNTDRLAQHGLWLWRVVSGGGWWWVVWWWVVVCRTFVSVSFPESRDLIYFFASRINFFTAWHIPGFNL